MSTEKPNESDLRTPPLSDMEWERTKSILEFLALPTVQTKQIAGQFNCTEKSIRDLRKKASNFPIPLIATLSEVVQDYLINISAKHRPDLKAELEDHKKTLPDETSAVELTRQKHMEELSSTLLKLIENLKLVKRKYHGLSDWLIDDIALTEEEQKQLESYDSYMVKCLFTHLQSEVTELREIDNIGQLRVRNITDELLNGLSVIAYRRDFTGTCDICRDWQS